MNEDYVKNIYDKIDSITDIELKKLVLKLIDDRNALKNQIKVDTLTGVYNRRILSDINKFSSIVICDIDDFKNINDNYGHYVGDKVLKLVASTLKNNSNNGIICRYGGDEFLIIFEKCPNNLVKKQMEIIKCAMNSVNEDLNFDITLSYGISFNKGDSTLESVIKEADEALYNSKNNGKNIIMYHKK